METKRTGSGVPVIDATTPGPGAVVSDHGKRCPRVVSQRIITDSSSGRCFSRLSLLVALDLLTEQNSITLAITIAQSRNVGQSRGLNGLLLLGNIVPASDPGKKSFPRGCPQFPVMLHFVAVA